MNNKKSMTDNDGFTKLSVVAGGVADVLKHGKMEGSQEMLGNCGKQIQARHCESLK